MASEYLNTIKEYISGKIDLDQLSAIIDDRLFDLRQNPNSMTKEQSVLSNIELLICEIKDGFRTTSELDEYAKSLILPRVFITRWDGVKIPVLTVTSSSNYNVNIPQEIIPQVVPA